MENGGGWDVGFESKKINDIPSEKFADISDECPHLRVKEYEVAPIVLTARVYSMVKAAMEIIPKNEWSAMLKTDEDGVVVDMVFPKQKGNAGTVDFEDTPEERINWDGIIHSHHTATKCNFSTIDKHGINMNYDVSVLVTWKSSTKKDDLKFAGARRVWVDGKAVYSADADVQLLDPDFDLSEWKKTVEENWDKLQYRQTGKTTYTHRNLPYLPKDCFEGQYARNNSGKTRWDWTANLEDLVLIKEWLVRGEDVEFELEKSNDLMTFYKKSTIELLKHDSDRKRVLVQKKYRTDDRLWLTISSLRNYFAPKKDSRYAISICHENDGLKYGQLLVVSDKDQGKLVGKSVDENTLIDITFRKDGQTLKKQVMKKHVRKLRTTRNLTSINNKSSEDGTSKSSGLFDYF